MKKFYLSLLLVFICSAIVLSGCGTTTLPKSQINAATIGNGGMAVVKDGYLYYANGYVDVNEYTSINDNKFGREVRGAIYKTKLDSNHGIQKDEDGFLKNTEVVVPHVVGFDHGGFFIIGEYIYYLTPLMEEDGKTTELLKGHIEVCRVKMDGTKQERVYKTKNPLDEAMWAVYNVDGKPVVVIVDGKDLKAITIDGKKKSEQTLAKDMTSLSLIKQPNYKHDTDALKTYEKNIYYTRDATSIDENPNAKNLLCSVHITSGKETVLESDNDKHYTMIENKNGYIYYARSEYAGSESLSNILHMRDITRPNQKETAITVAGQGQSFREVLVIDKDHNQNGNKIIIEGNSNTLIRVEQNGYHSQLLYKSDSSFTLVSTRGSYVYIEKEGQIFRLNALETHENQTPVQLTDSEKTYYTNSLPLIDIDGYRLFVFANYMGENEESNFYLNIVENISSSTSNEFVSKFVGKFKDGECPEKPTNVDEDGNEIEDDEQNDLPWII